jgi:regulator of RNase E activity RraA
MNLEIREKIVQFLRRNRVSTTEVADCLGKTGAIEGIMPVNPGMYAAGVIKYVYAHSESNWPVHEQIRDIPPDHVIIMDSFEVNGRALVGELVTKYLCLYKQSCALVAIGKIRDANDLIKNRYPVWCLGVTPVGCFNNQVQETPEIQSAARERSLFFEGAIAVCDDTGVVIIPKEHITEEFYNKLDYIEQQEDIWFDCIDRKKMNTFETVCLKKYKNN